MLVAAHKDRRAGRLHADRALQVILFGSDLGAQKLWIDIGNVKFRNSFVENTITHNEGGKKWIRLLITKTKDGIDILQPRVLFFLLLLIISVTYITHLGHASIFRFDTPLAWTTSVGLFDLV